MRSLPMISQQHTVINSHSSWQKHLSDMFHIMLCDRRPDAAEAGSLPVISQKRYKKTSTSKQLLSPNTWRVLANARCRRQLNVEII